MNTPESEATPETVSRWAAEWLDAVADGTSTMSQRKLSSVEACGGGLEAVKALARQQGVHLLLLEDDNHKPLPADFLLPETKLDFSRLKPTLL